MRFNWHGFKKKKRTHILGVPVEDIPKMGSYSTDFGDKRLKPLTEEESLKLLMTTPQALVAAKYVEKMNEIINLSSTAISQAAADYSAELAKCPPLPEELKYWKILK